MPSMQEYLTQLVRYYIYTFVNTNRYIAVTKYIVYRTYSGNHLKMFFVSFISIILMTRFISCNVQLLTVSQPVF